MAMPSRSFSSKEPISMDFCHRTLFVIGSLGAIAVACIWDDITTKVEEAPFPTDLQLITGEFPRQGEAFLRWKAHDRVRKVQARDESNPGAWDDLASSLDKLGHTDSALAVMLRKRERYGVSYETMANLGTYFFHAGRLAEGLPRIDSALKINPEAHFGREIYQRHLVAYFLSKGMSIPMDSSPSVKGAERGYAAFLARTQGTAGLSPKERAKAIKGVLGMMRFGDHRSPVLLEAWADLNAQPGTVEARHAAALGYLQASRRTSGAASGSYLALARKTIGEDSLAAIERILMDGEKRADDLVKKVAASEARMLLSTDWRDPDDQWSNEFLMVEVPVPTPHLRGVKQKWDPGKP